MQIGIDSSGLKKSVFISRVENYSLNQRNEALDQFTPIHFAAKGKGRRNQEPEERKTYEVDTTNVNAMPKYLNIARELEKHGIHVDYSASDQGMIIVGRTSEENKKINDLLNKNKVTYSERDASMSPDTEFAMTSGDTEEMVQLPGESLADMMRRYGVID